MWLRDGHALRHVGAENLCHLAGCSADRWLLGPAPPARAWDDLRLVGLKLIFLIVTRAVSLLGLSRREWWWKDAEILMLRHQLAVARARAASRSFAFDVAGPGVAGAARGDGAGGAPGGDAADRHSRHDLALAARHRPPPVGAPVAPGPVRAPGDASQGAVGGAAAGPGERVVGIPADPRRARGARHHGGAVHGLADPQETPGSARRRAGMARAGRSSCGPRRRGSWRWTSSPPTCSTARRSTSWPPSSTAPAASGSSEPPSIRSSRG